MAMRHNTDCICKGSIGSSDQGHKYTIHTLRVRYPSSVPPEATRHKDKTGIDAVYPTRAITLLVTTQQIVT